MIKLLGSVLVAGGAALWGHHAAAMLRSRSRVLEELEVGLALLEQELNLSAPELSRLMEELSRRTRGAARALFGALARGLEGAEPPGTAMLWEEAVRSTPCLIPEGQLCLLSLGEILGRYEAREQAMAVAAVRARLTALRQEYARQCAPKCRVLQTVGITGGAFLVILLL